MTIRLFFECIYLIQYLTEVLLTLVDASIMAGADCAIGFKDEILPKDANDWLDAFLEAHFIQGKNIEKSIDAANKEVDILSDIVYVAYGN